MATRGKHQQDEQTVWLGLRGKTLRNGSAKKNHRRRSGIPGRKGKTTEKANLEYFWGEGKGLATAQKFE